MATFNEEVVATAAAEAGRTGIFVRGAGGGTHSRSGTGCRQSLCSRRFACHWAKREIATLTMIWALLNAVAGLSVTSHGAQQKRYFNDTLTIIEAENFTYINGEYNAAALPDCRGLPWSACAWADGGNLFASDVSNVFMSRRAYLHADANATFGAQATAVVPVGSTGLFTVMARYEAGYRFHSPFKVDVQQNGSTLFSKVFGLRTTPKVWGFQRMRETDWTQGCGPGLQPECRWVYSATENMVWEGTTAAYTVNLTKGLATITLTVVGVSGSSDEEDSLNGALAGDRWGVETTNTGDLITERNIDAIMLHPNQTDIAFRMNTTLFPSSDGDGLVFDSLLATQEGEVFARVTSKFDAPMALGFPRTLTEALSGRAEHISHSGSTLARTFTFRTGQPFLSRPRANGLTTPGGYGKFRMQAFAVWRHKSLALF
eukprot:SAG11_NODE_873_length_6802_cov_2.257646_1_plen_430_part_00